LLLNVPWKMQLAKFSALAMIDPGSGGGEWEMRRGHGPDCRRPQSNRLGHTGTTTAVSASSRSMRSSTVPSELKSWSTKLEKAPAASAPAVLN
jgi:hypothetical protein